MGEKFPKLMSHTKSEIREAQRTPNRINSHPTPKRVKHLKYLREKTHQARILCTAKLSFKSEGEIKTFSDKQKMRECVLSVDLSV